MSVTADQFQFVRGLVERRSAIVLEPGKEYLVESRLGPVAKSAGMTDIGALVEALRRNPPRALEDRVIEAMTTNETSFFRDLHPFEQLKKRVLPELVKRKAAVRQLRIWSAACSTGQEALSVVMTIREHFPELASWSISVLCTDLSTEVLERARNGLYRQLEINRGLPAPLLLKYFQRDGADWRAKRELTSLLEFRQLNLIEPWPVLPSFDVIFIRNVLIYFDLPVKRRILANMRGALAPGGFLFLGGAETTLNIDPAYQRAFPETGGCYQVK